LGLGTGRLSVLTGLEVEWEWDRWKGGGSGTLLLRVEREKGERDMILSMCDRCYCMQGGMMLLIYTD
jgi:hypothetical protein